MVGKKEYAQINELLNMRLDAKKVLIAVHRGAWGGNIIEGTVPSLELALKMGADMFECDLSKSTDGVIYAFHDTQEPRLLKTKQNVKTMTSAEIDALEFYNSIDEPSGKHVQRFEEVVKYFTHGELFNNSREWKTIIAEQLIDYFRVHISQIGGITPARKLQIFAEQFGVRTAWHGPGDMSPLAHAANIHIDLAAQNFGIQEWSGIEPPNFVIQELKGPHGALLEVFPGFPEYKDGYVYANDKPGLGVDLDEKEAAKYPCEKTVTTWTQTRGRDGALVTP